MVTGWSGIPKLPSPAVGAVLGTIAGTLVLQRLPERTFRISVDVLIIALGLFMLSRAFGGR
jgi:uncharacterized membrane protein YfcA